MCSLNFEIFLYFSLTSSETRSTTAHKCLYQLFFLKFHAKIKKLSWRSFLIQRSEYLLFHLICSHQWLALQTRSFNNFSKVIEEIYEGTFLVKLQNVDHNLIKKKILSKYIIKISLKF